MFILESYIYLKIQKLLSYQIVLYFTFGTDEMY